MKALGLYPLETWWKIGDRIFIAEGREPKSKNQRKESMKKRTAYFLKLTPVYPAAKFPVNWLVL